MCISIFFFLQIFEQLSELVHACQPCSVVSNEARANNTLDDLKRLIINFIFFYYKSFQINLIILIRMIFNNTTLVFFLKYSIPGPVIRASSHSADFSIVWIYKFYFSSNRAYFRIRVFIILGYISNSNSVFHQ